jgi:hypothetical protein
MAKMASVFNSVRIPLIALPPLRYGVSNSKSRGLPPGVGGKVRLSLELKTQWKGNRYSDMGALAFLVLKECADRPLWAGGCGG